MSFHVHGCSADGEAAASSISHGHISFSSPLQRVPTRPSNNPRKRMESAAEFGDDDDDDFVVVPPRAAAESSKTNTIDARKIKKSKSSIAEPKHPEGFQNPSKRTIPNYRSAPNKVVEAIKILSRQQKDKIREYPFGPLLDLKLKGLENTKLLVFLMDRLDPDTLTFDFGNGKPLKITRCSIQSVLGLRNRGKHMVAPDSHKQKEALSKLKQKLGIEPGVDIKVQDLVTWLGKHETDPFSIRCFRGEMKLESELTHEWYELDVRKKGEKYYVEGEEWEMFASIYNIKQGDELCFLLGPAIYENLHVGHLLRASGGIVLPRCTIAEYEAEQDVRRELEECTSSVDTSTLSSDGVESS